MLRRLWLIVAHTEPQNAAVWLGVYAIVWGLALLSPHQTFTGGPSFVWLATLANEDVWGVVAVACGLAQIGAVACFGWRMLAAMGVVDCLWWMFLAVGMGLANASPVPTYMFAAFSILGLWVFLNVILWRPQR